MTGELIGQTHPASVLRAEVGRTLDSHGGLVLVTGEAGIGKTTLVSTTMEEARGRGALVLSGSCWDSDSVPGYWPWVQVLRALRRAVGAGAWAESAGDGLAALLGEAGAAEPVQEFQLYDAVVTTLVAAAQERPVVVVLDDLHWADPTSLKLLEFAAQHTWFERLLLIGTYRDVEVEAADHALRPLLLPLLARATVVTLTGLGRDEVGELITRTTGAAPEAELVTEVHRRTGGNPFFVEQTARLWHSGGSVSAVAPGVRDALRRRLALLPKPVAGLITAAAALGREFHRQVLAATVTAPVPQVDRMLEQAMSARLVVALGAGRFAFAHDLVRETLYESLDEAAARRWHAAVVHAIDRSPALADRVFPAELARHAYLAGGEVERARARELLLAAADDAGSRLAFEEHNGHLHRAFELTSPDEPRSRVMVALALGSATHRGGDRDGGWRLYTEAAELARRMDDPEVLARVALTLFRTGNAGEHVRLKTDLLHEARGKLVGGTPTPLLGAVSPDSIALELAVRLATLARTGGDDDMLTFGLWSRHHSSWGLGKAAERAQLVDEIAEVARRTGDHETEQFAVAFRWVALLEQGDPRYLDRFHDFVTTADESGKPRVRTGAAMDRSIIAALHGSFAEAEAYQEQIRLPADQAEHVHFDYLLHHIRWNRLLMQGRFDDLAELHRSARADYPFARLTEAVTAAHRGDAELALRLLAEIDGEAGPYPSEVSSLLLRLRAQAAALSGDAERCARVRAELAPHSGQWLVSLFGGDVAGPVDHWLGVLDAARQRWDDAVEEFTAAWRSAELLQARPWSVEARTGLALARQARGGPGDPAAAAELFAQVRQEAGTLGMRHIAERAGHGDAAAPAGPRGNEFRRTGEVWSLTMDGHTAHLPDAKGLRDLHQLLSAPGTDIPATRLLDPEGGEVVVAARSLGGDAMLDEEAKAQYKRRLARLDDEIERASGLGDDERAAELDRERDALLHELRAAAGLAGRNRRLGDEAERARKTVTARIRDTLRKLDERHPAMAAHLRATVSTGSTCRYQPDDGISWRL